MIAILFRKSWNLLEKLLKMGLYDAEKSYPIAYEEPLNGE